MDAVARRREAIRLLSEQLWFALAIAGEGDVPSISYVPFAIVGRAFGIAVSRLSAHSAPLLARRPASVLLVDTFAPISDAYTRARFSISVAPAPQIAHSADANAIWSALEHRQGETIQTLRALPDFDTILLEPNGGRLILGFASAHNLSGTAIAELMENAS
jgi:putative heme iron utilization protein